MNLRFPSPFVVAAAAGLTLAACTGGTSAEKTGCDANPLDQVLCPEYEAAGYQPVEAAPQELCTRLHVDLLGVRPTKAQIDDACAGRDIVDVVRKMQSSKDYRLTQRRRWADRFQYSDYTVDVASIKRLDALVDDLYEDKIGYRDFAVIALSHPGFVGRHIGYGQPDLVAEAAFKAFLGRTPTTPERLDVGNLWKPWSGSGFIEDGPVAFAGDEAGGFFGYGYEPMVDPFACESGVRSCESTLLGYASVEFPRHGRESFITASDLTAEDWDALREPGRLFTSLPMFWEAQVDEVLMRYLGYDLGKIRPEARQRLVEHFKATGGDLRKLERVVLTSWAYRQPAIDEPARPDGMKFQTFAYGPTKPMIAESFIKSVGRLAGEEAGDCDWRYPNLPEWYYPDANLDDVLDDVYPRTEDGYIDTWFRNVAIQMGGCPGTMDFNTYQPRERSSHVGLMAAVAQEEAVVELCFVRAATSLVPAGVDPLATDERALRHTVRNVLERSLGGATDADVHGVMTSRTADCGDCTAEAMARDLCAGIASGAEFLFY